MRWVKFAFIVGLPLGLAHLAQLLVNQHLQAEFSAITHHAARQCSGHENAIHHLAQFLRFKTLSDASSSEGIRAGHEEAFVDLLSYLADTYAEVHQHLHVEHVGAGGWSRLYTWQGSDPSLKPILYISHYDVVPVTPGTEQDWAHGPFDGVIADGFLWGRGALDVKVSVIALLEAVTSLIQQGWQPSRTVILSFGHDEEVGGKLGAKEVAQLLESRGVKLELVVDEGGVVLVDGFAGLSSSPMALVGTAEKTYTSLLVELASAGGHSSMPPTDGSDVGMQAARLLTYLHNHPFPAELKEPMVSFMQALAPAAPSLYQSLLAFAHIPGIRQLLGWAMSHGGAQLAALVRTTLVATRLEAGVADNVLPNKGMITLNLRSHPDVPRASLLAHVQAAVAATKVQATVSVSPASHDGAPGFVTPSTGPHFQALRQAIEEFWRDGNKPVTVVPLLMTGGTDSKHFNGLTENGILRFVPMGLNRTAGELGSIHSTNERLRVDDMPRMVCTYARLIELLSQ